LEAKHFIHWQILFHEVEKGYSSSKNTKSVLEQFKKVEARGRYKDSY
jgi:tRNA A-37 threonylcarbamoyl transferase component Bud32